MRSTNTGIRRPVVKDDRIAVRSDRQTARKNDIVHIPKSLIRLLWTENPGFPTLEADIRTFQVEEG
jgi:hypothetical protein